MFNWLKRLFNPNKLLPKDVETGLMTSMFCNVKFGEKLVVPDNCVCYLSYRDKIYSEFTAGSFDLDEKTLDAIVSKQKRTDNKKKKQVKFDLFFVNLSAFDYETKQKEVIPVDKKLSKIEIKTNFTCAVTDATKFRKYALSFYALIRPIDAENLVKDFVREHINKYYLKRELFTPIEDAAEAAAFKAYLNKKAERFGFAFNRFDMALWVKAKDNNKGEKQENVKKFSFFERQNSTLQTTKEQQPKQEAVLNEKENATPKQEKNIDNAANKEYNLDNAEQIAAEKQSKEEICPICQSKRIANSAFCHRCGYKF